MFVFQFKSKEIHGELNLSKEKLEKELNGMLSSRFNMRDAVINVSVFLIKDGNLVPGKNSISLKIVGVPNNKLSEVAGEILNRVNKLLEKTPYRCESNLLAFKPLVPGKKGELDPVKAYFSLEVMKR